MTPLAIFLSAFTVTFGTGLITWWAWQSWVEAGDDGLIEFEDEGAL